MTPDNIDKWRKRHLAVAEMIDSWRLVPRLLVFLYGILLWKIVSWYMNLQPKLIKDCDVEVLKEACIISAPTTQHAALVTAIVGVAAAVFGLYTSSGKKWNGFTNWSHNDPKND